MTKTRMRVAARKTGRAALFCVFDGHGGRRCAEWAAEAVPARVFANLNDAERSRGPCGEPTRSRGPAAAARWRFPRGRRPATWTFCGDTTRAAAAPRIFDFASGTSFRRVQKRARDNDAPRRSWPAALAKAFPEADALLWEKAQSYGREASGCTALVALFDGRDKLHPRRRRHLFYLST